MFGQNTIMEETIEKRANEAIFLSKDHNKDLNTAVREISDRYSLNNNEIERVCARVNHNIFNEKFAQMKTSTFKIAKYDEVINMSKSSVEHDVKEFKTVSEKDFPEEKTASFNKVAAEMQYIEKGEIGNHIFSPKKLAEFENDALNNANDAGIMQNTSKDILYKLKNHIVELVKLGETPESIEKMLVEILGEQNAEEIKAFLSDTFKEIDGKYENLNVKQASSSSYYLDSKLQKLATSYMETIENLVKSEYLHENYMDCLVYNGKQKIAAEIDERMPNMYLVGIYLQKNAKEISKILNKEAANVPPTGQAPSVSPQASTSAPFNWKGSVGTAAIATATPLLAGLGMHGVGSMISSIRRDHVKKTLLQDFPELQNIDRAKYENIYDSLTGLEPALTKAPYALAEMIKKHNEYGTIDTDTTLRLLGSNKQNVLGPAVMRDHTVKTLTEGAKNVMNNRSDYEKESRNGNRN